jgi:stage V sporulation protein R
MDSFINPKEFVAEQKYKVEMAKQEDKRFPLQSERDVLKFLMDSAPIDDWKRDVIAIIRDEAYYFLPQRQTKIMNEGWASYWHSKLMTKHVLTDGELIDYADHHSGTLATQPGQINPYKLGIELFRNIEERWDRGQFGKEWEQCDDYRVRRQWDKKLGLGKEKIFEVRKLYNDVTFIDEFLTDEFAEDQKMYNYAFNRRTGQYEIVDRDFKKIKQNLLFSLTNSGQPLIDLVDANYENRGELLFTHRYENMDLDLDKAKLTLANVQAIWTRPVHLVTQMEGVQKMLTHDGKRSTEKEI